MGNQEWCKLNAKYAQQMCVPLLASVAKAEPLAKKEGGEGMSKPPWEKQGPDVRTNRSGSRKASHHTSKGKTMGEGKMERQN